MHKAKDVKNVSDGQRAVALPSVPLDRNVQLRGFPTGLRIFMPVYCLHNVEYQVFFDQECFSNDENKKNRIFLHVFVRVAVFYVRDGIRR